MGKSWDHFRMAADRTGDAERRAGNRHEADELEVRADQLLYFAEAPL